MFKTAFVDPPACAALRGVGTAFFDPACTSEPETEADFGPADGSAASE